MTNLNALNELLKMLSAKMDFFMIKACAESAGFEFLELTFAETIYEIS